MPTIDEISTTELMPIVREHGISYLSLFGSVARGDEKPDSDIDLAVRFDHPASLFDYVDVRLKMEAALNRSVDLIPIDDVYPSVRDSMNTDTIVIFDIDAVAPV